jgi:hypothetical protein
VPDGCVDLLASVGRARGRSEGEARAWVFGAKTRALVVAAERAVDNVAVRFRPGAACRFLDTDGSALVDGAVELGEIWGGQGRELVARLGAARDLATRRRLLERALLERLPRAVAGRDGGDAIVRSAVEVIRRAQGRLGMRALEAVTGVGGRRLQRIFQARVGFAPKVLARIVRFQAAYAELAGASPREVFGRTVSDSSKKPGRAAA